MDYFFFIALPYTAIIVMLAGSILRYRISGFVFSSLSSQFLEGRKLFWGSQPFHWGIILLFFGHLIAFLFPGSVLAWNGEPVRLLVLEASAFAFGLATLLGLILLIRRRIVSRRIRVVTSGMDVFVLVILLVQVVSGLWIAYFHRWGSSWFAAALTPYLISIFKFNPQIDAVVAMPLAVKIHIISAYTLVGMIPFTRFVHFLVYPIRYIWRDYQRVIWNWDRKRIRMPNAWVKGVRAKNH